jgi:AcrR family transcriptional regulator
VSTAAAASVTWSGSPRPGAKDARERILAAAVRCVETVGAQRTSTSLIARTAGVSRPTLYAYFANREELVDLAAQEAVLRVVARMQQHCHTFSRASDRAVEALMYALYDLRHLPAMATHFAPGDVIVGPLSREELWFARQALEPVIELWPALRATMDDAAELYVRMLISLLIREPMQTRNREEDRVFLCRWWPRALGIDAADGQGG